MAVARMRYEFAIVFCLWRTPKTYFIYMACWFQEEDFGQDGEVEDDEDDDDDDDDDEGEFY